MRASFILVCGGFVLAAVACAASEDRDEPTPSPDDGGGIVTREGGSPEVDAGKDASIEPPRCSAAGWCITDLPDVDLLMKDVWPLSARAFAIAESPTLGVKVLEWSDAEAKWKYIDDSTQNQSGFGRYAGKIWAPSEDEVYFTVSPGYVYHGARPVPPATAWTWTRQRLVVAAGASADPDDGNPNYWKRDMVARIASLGVWGTGPSDVYAWFKNTVFHRTIGDGGAAEWVPEYVASDADAAAEQLYFFGAGGTGPDDIWFSGGRGRVYAGCALLVRKTAASYRKIADGTLAGSFRPCTPRAGVAFIGGGDGWLTDIQALSSNQLVALKGARDLVRISPEGEGASFSVASVSETAAPRALNSLWTATEKLWATGTGIVVEGSNAWDGGEFKVSTISLSGGPLNRPIFQVRGTSNTNLWAMGVRHALHKTTP